MDTNDVTSEVSRAPLPAYTLPTGEISKLIAQFVALRDRKTVLEAQHKEAMKPFTVLMEEIQRKLLTHMQHSGVESVSSTAGTAYQNTKRSATIKDGQAFRDFVAQHQAYDLADWRANPVAVFEYIQEHNGEAPPGVNASSYVTVGVRRPTETAED